MNSFGILRTNVGLTTNVKIMVGSDYRLSLDTFDSNDELSIDRYKNFKFNKNNYYDELIPSFYKNTPTDISFQIKYNNDVDNMSNNFSSQYDEIYNYGARNIINNKNYKEEYEYFAPLYIKKNNLPSSFIIFRVDGSGLENITKENFKISIIDKLKFVKMFDLSIDSDLGQWLDKNFVTNQYFPDSPLEIDFRTLEFSKWNGIDYETGGYASKSIFLDTIIEEEREIFELEKIIFDGYKNNKVVFPNILNFSFLFDDEPSTPEIKRKWSLNRYFGFYINKIEFIKTISPYKTPKLRQDVEILSGNLLFSPSNPQNPFLEDWTDDKPFYIEYNGSYYLVNRFDERRNEEIMQAPDNGFINEEYQRVIFKNYKIISDLDLTNKQTEINKNYGFINEDNMLMVDEVTPFQINNFDESDVWLIDIDGVYHNLTKLENGIIKINSDYSFKFSSNFFDYKVSSVSKRVSFLVDFNNQPKKFNIFRLNFTDIKDFDTRIVDTEYSKYEYEKETELSNTDETKMYFENPLSSTNPKEIDDFIYNDKVVNIPVSSEYTANYETFKVTNGDLSDIWRINPVYCRWVYQNSLSSNDYPYLLNNSLIFEEYNRTVNPFEQSTNRSERNLDYFYTINSSTSSYLHHSLHIEEFNNSSDLGCSEYLLEFIDNCAEVVSYTDCQTGQTVTLSPLTETGTWPIGFTLSFNSTTIPTSQCLDASVATYSVKSSSGCKLEFKVDDYINAEYDYFTNLFNRKSHFNDFKITKNVKKHSYFNKGDESIPNITLFRGIEFKIYDVESIKLNTTNQIEGINVSNSNTFEDYRFSILLTSGDSNLEWEIIDEWQIDKYYATGSIVVFDDIFYTSTTDSIVKEPSINLTVGSSQIEVSSSPYTRLGWTPSSIQENILWSPNITYTSFGTASFVYNNGNFYECIDENSTVDFWNPVKSISTGYNINDIVLYKDKYWISMTGSNWVKPGTDIKKNKTREFLNRNGDNYKYWQPTTPNSSKWMKIQIWNPGIQYEAGTYIIHNETVYISNSTIEIGEEPGKSVLWQRKYSINPDTNYIYKIDNNPVIINNNRYYLVKSNISNETLDNGIHIYINKKWKNILINIYINDNTLPNITNTDRDLLYNDIYNKLTAYNFINCINNLSNKYDFSDFVKYTIINEDGSHKTYSFDNGIANLPYIISCEYPDAFLVKVDSIVRKPLNIRVNPFIRLNNGNITSISNLNWYNNIPVAYSIDNNKKTSKIFKNYNDNKNIEYIEIYRFGGYYMPLFYDIELFNRDCKVSKNIGNYIFDTSLTDFGIIKERKIRKINRSGSVLKFRDSKTEKSIYPMIDEFGYSCRDFMIFKSTWDSQYHTEIVDNKPRLIVTPQKIIKTPLNIGLPIAVKIENNKKYNL
jgi:hypothetical protein